MRWVALSIALTLSPPATADILHLRDGSRHYGLLVSQNEHEIVFRVVSADGASSVVQSFPTARVARVERTGQLQTPPPHRIDGADPVALGEDYEQMLREGLELLDDGDLGSAVRALQRAVLRAPQEVLAQLDQQCRAARGVPLDELLAASRIRLADQEGRGRSFKLKYATPYERDALARLLARERASLLARRYDGRSVAEWAANRAEYTELTPAARPLVADASRAAALIVTRLRFDRRLKQNREERVRLLRLRAELSRLAGQILALPGYTAPSEEEDSQNAAEPTSRPSAAGGPPASQPVDDVDRDNTATHPDRPSRRREATPPAKGNWQP